MPGQRRALERKPPAMPPRSDPPGPVRDDSFGFQLVAQSDPDMFGRSDLFGAESGRHGVDRLKIRGKWRGKLRSRSCESWQAPARAVRVLFENLFQFIALHVRYPSSLAVNRPRDSVLAARRSCAPDHAEFPVRVLAAAFAPCAIAIWNSRSNSSSVRQSSLCSKPEYHEARKPAYPGGNCSIARSRCTRSIEPVNSRSGAPISLRGPLDSCQGRSSLQRSPPAAFSFRNFINTTLTCEPVQPG